MTGPCIECAACPVTPSMGAVFAGDLLGPSFPLRIIPATMDAQCRAVHLHRHLDIQGSNLLVFWGQPLVISLRATQDLSAGVSVCCRSPSRIVPRDWWISGLLSTLALSLIHAFAILLLLLLLLLLRRGSHAEDPMRSIRQEWTLSCLNCATSHPPATTVSQHPDQSEIHRYPTPPFLADLVAGGYGIRRCISPLSSFSQQQT